MANGQRRAKLKNALSPPPPQPAAPPDPAQDDELLDDLFAELDNRSPEVQQEAATVLNDIQVNNAASPPPPSEGKKGSKQRFKEREARKIEATLAAAPASDPEADARLRREVLEEEKSIGDTCTQLGVEMVEIPPDGHCLYSAVADQLELLGVLPKPHAHYKTTRAAAADFMSTHSNDFIPFLPSLDGEDGAGATDETGLMTPAAFRQYCSAVRDSGVWGGEPEILALSRAYNVPIHVVQRGPPPVVVHTPVHGAQALPGSPTVFISYHRRMYGLGEHYNSLRPKAGHLSKLMNKLDQHLS